jgi:multidrug efflux pump
MTRSGPRALLAGIINDGIVLIDRIDIEISENGLSPPQAVIQAAQQMAIAIMSGLLFSTMLTLGFVPLMYSLFYRVSFKDFVYLGD